MSASVLQEAATTSVTSASATTVVTPAFGLNCTVGSTIECYVTFAHTTAPTSVVDSASQTYTLATSVYDGNDDQTLGLYTFKNNQSTAKLTITATFATSTPFRGAWSKEIGGVTTSPLQTQSGHYSPGPGGGAGAISMGSVTPTAQPGLLSAVCYESGIGSVPATPTCNTGAQGTTGWNLGSAPNLAVSSSQRLLSTSTTAATFTTTDVSGSFFLAIGAIYTEGSSGPPPSGPMARQIYIMP